MNALWDRLYAIFFRLFEHLLSTFIFVLSLLEVLTAVYVPVTIDLDLLLTVRLFTEVKYYP
jgi:hypothetical protein